VRPAWLVAVAVLIVGCGSPGGGGGQILATFTGPEMDGQHNQTFSVSQTTTVDVTGWAKTESASADGAAPQWPCSLPIELKSDSGAVDDLTFGPSTTHNALVLTAGNWTVRGQGIQGPAVLEEAVCDLSASGTQVQVITK
jgi:hypothetical protein